MSALDREVRLTDKELAVFDAVDDAIRQARENEDPTVAIDVGRQLRRMGQVSGLALAKLLYKLWNIWFVFETDDFQDYVEAALGITPQTLWKYVRLWEAVFENPNVPDDIKQRLFGKPVGGLLLLTAAAREGQLSREDWEEIADAPDKKSIREIVRRVRGQQTSSSMAVVGLIDREGYLYAKRGDGPPRSAGFLVLDSQFPEVEILVNRIIESLGIVRI